MVSIPTLPALPRKAEASTNSAINAITGVIGGITGGKVEELTTGFDAGFSGKSAESDQATAVSEPISFSPTANPLSDLFLPSYHWKFYLTSEVAKLDDSNPTQIIIAETGSTGINIRDVQMEAVVGPNIRTKNAMATSITMTLLEPYGARLPDFLFQSAVKLGIKNYMKAPWTLELRFSGQDEAGGAVFLDGKAWRWKVMILDIQSKISDTGSEHTVSFVPMPEIALENQHAVLSNAISVEADNVGEILKGVIEKMNTEAATEYGKKHLIYDIVDRPYPSDHGTVGDVESPFKHKIISTTPTKDDARNQGIGHFSPGTDLLRIIDALFAGSETAVSMARLSRDFKDGDGSKDSEADDAKIKEVNSVLHRIDTDVEITGWNRVIGDYSRKITYIVRPYDSVRLITSAGQADKFVRDKDFQRKKAKFIVDNKLISKSYEYIFTGLNTEVEKFDVQVNFNWAVSVPLLRGRTHYGSATVPQEINDQLFTNRWVTLEQADDAAQIYDEAVSKIEDDTLRVQEQENVQRIKDRNDKTRNGIGEELDERNEDLDRTQQGVIAFGEDLVEEESTDKDAPTLSLPLTVFQDGDRPSAGTDFSTASQWHEGRSIYGSLLNQLYGAFDGNLQTIDLTVRGDPYWLGSGQSIAEKDEKSNDTTPNFLNGEHIFMFRFKLPLGYDQDTGSVAIAEDGGGTSDIYSGFYATVTVNHSFSEGKYTQVLNGVRIPGWVLDDVIKLDGNNEKGTTR